MDTVSVIIPTFNRAALLERAVRSALEQGDAVLEVLICDDGGTDDARARTAAIGDARVRWVEGPRAGRPAVPRNRGITAATGEWLAFLDDDDRWLPGKLKRQFEAMRRTGAQASCTNARRMAPDGTDRGNYFTDGDALFALADLLPVNRVICSSVIARRDLVLGCGGFPEAPDLRALEDYALWLRLSLATRFAYCAEPLVAYLDAPEGSVRSDSLPLPVQRDRVLSDLWRWGRAGRFGPGQRRLASRYLRGARRSAGRPIHHWLFLR